MSPSRLRRSAVVAMLLLAIGGPPPAVGQSRRTSASAVSTGDAAGASGRTTIAGVARTAKEEPVTNAPVRLRNARTGKIVARTTTDARGEFTFEPGQAGIYVPELLDGDGQILAAGDMLALEEGESVTTIITLPLRVRATGWFTDAAGAVIAAATSAGVLAVAATGPTASAVR